MITVIQSIALAGCCLVVLTLLLVAISHYSLQRKLKKSIADIRRGISYAEPVFGSTHGRSTPSLVNQIVEDAIATAIKPSQETKGDKRLKRKRNKKGQYEKESR